MSDTCRFHVPGAEDSRGGTSEAEGHFSPDQQSLRLVPLGGVSSSAVDTSLFPVGLLGLPGTVFSWEPCDQVPGAMPPPACLWWAPHQVTLRGPLKRWPVAPVSPLHRGAHLSQERHPVGMLGCGLQHTGLLCGGATGTPKSLGLILQGP